MDAAAFNNILFRQRPVHNLHNQENKENEELELTQLDRNDLLFIRNCKNCTYKIKASAVKVIIGAYYGNCGLLCLVNKYPERCISTTVYVDSALLAGTCEVIKCENISLFFNVAVPTITIDSTIGCLASFDLRAYYASHGKHPQLIWSNTTNLRMKLHNGPENLVPTAQQAKPDVDPAQAQFRVRLVDGGIENEHLIREGAGYLTTEREKEEHDRRDAQNIAAMRQALGR